MELYVLFNKSKYNKEYEFIGAFNSLVVMNNKIRFCETEYPYLFAKSRWKIKKN